MTLEDWGKVVEGLCSECTREKFQESWDAGPPSWLSQEGGGFLARFCPEYMEWVGATLQKQACLELYSMVSDFGDDEGLRLCLHHLYVLSTLLAERRK